MRASVESAADAACFPPPPPAPCLARRPGVRRHRPAAGLGRQAGAQGPGRRTGAHAPARQRGAAGLPAAPAGRPRPAAPPGRGGDPPAAAAAGAGARRHPAACPRPAAARGVAGDRRPPLARQAHPGGRRAGRPALRPAAAGRPGAAEHQLQRHAGRPRCLRPVPPAGSRPVGRVHAVPGRWRAPGLPAVRRARLEGAVDAVADRAAPPGGGGQHAGGSGRTSRPRPQARDLSVHAADAQLPAGLRRGPLRRARGRHRGPRRQPADALHRARRPRGRCRLRRRRHRPGAGGAGGLVRHAPPLRQARQPGPAADHRLRRHGTRRPGDLCIHPAAGQPGRAHAAVRARLRGRRRARAGPPVVRQPGHAGLVGRPVAQRELRVLAGRQDHRPGAARLGLAHQRAAGPCVRHARRPAGHRPPHRAAGAAGRGHGQPVGCHHLREGPDGAGHVRGLARARRLPGRRAPLHAAPCLGRGHQRRFLPRAGRRRPRPARCGAQLHAAGRHPAAGGHAAVRRRAAAAAAGAIAAAAGGLVGAAGPALAAAVAGAHAGRHQPAADDRCRGHAGPARCRLPRLGAGQCRRQRLLAHRLRQ